MIALTLTQPWATLVAIGAKKIETRSWQTCYRGPLAIHAAKGLGPVGGTKGLRDLCGREPFCTVLTAWANEYSKGYSSLADMVKRPLFPLGAIIATCRLTVVAPTQNVKVSDQERAFGDYTSGRFAWVLEDVQMLPTPIPARGALGLWEWNKVTV